VPVFVIRDHNGAFLATCGERIDEVITLELAEALAVRRAVSFILEEGYSRVIVGSDCLAVVQRITSPHPDRSFCGPVIEDVKIMARSFESCVFRHVYHVLNIVAHNLAKSCEFSLATVWRGVLPGCIQEAICNDIMIS
jgi:hypothetical protein